jgi:hypothetical protein
MTKKYIVFVSYSHRDREKVENIVRALQENSLRPMWDENFSYGSGFHDQIKKFIACSHIFMPFITSESSTRGWVHQEIGYAMALNIPVLPITLDQIPGEMLQHLLAVSYTDNMEDLKTRLAIGAFEKLVNKAQKTSRPQYDCAELPEDRTDVMVEYATMVLDLGYDGLVRQKGGLSSFHIPDKLIQHPAWQDRYGDHYRANRCRMQRQERQVLEKHALLAGCRLIVDPYIDYSYYGPQAKEARLSELIEFLNISSANIEIVAVRPRRGEDHLTIVGDWFSAHAITANIVEGIQHTIFTRHAPSIESMIEIFDEEFNDHLIDMEIAPENSKKVALEILGRELEITRQNTRKGMKRGKP